VLASSTAKLLIGKELQIMPTQPQITALPRRRTVLAASIGAGIGAALALAQGTVFAQNDFDPSRPAPTPPPPPPSPKLTASTIDGESVTLDKYLGKAVLITFWATWCPTCRHEMPELRAFYKANRANGFEWLNISIDEKLEDILQWRNVLRATGTDSMSPVIWLKAPGTQHNFGRIRGTPTHIIVDRKGEEHLRFSGAFRKIGWDSLKQTLAARG
jgi:cytochrome c biogenesis protein CcmG, thiol:disulfide interchange protein DsbE